MKLVTMILLISLAPAIALADSSKPTCEEEPTRRDCINVEAPSATPPKQTVKQGEPSNPVAKPFPATGQGKEGVSKGR